MTAERLFLNNALQEAIRSQKKTTKRRKRPEELLCDMLNRLSPQQRQAVADRLR
jgi:hypothetical protein